MLSADCGAAEKFVPSPLHETLLEKPRPSRAQVRSADAQLVAAPAPEPVPVAPPSPQRAKHAVYRSHTDLVPSYNPLD